MHYECIALPAELLRQRPLKYPLAPPLARNACVPALTPYRNIPRSRRQVSGGDSGSGPGSSGTCTRGITAGGGAACLRSPSRGSPTSATEAGERVALLECIEPAGDRRDRHPALGDEPVGSPGRIAARMHGARHPLARSRGHCCGLGTKFLQPAWILCSNSSLSTKAARNKAACSLSTATLWLILAT
jgi:hypothetical protein